MRTFTEVRKLREEDPINFIWRIHCVQCPLKMDCARGGYNTNNCAKKWNTWLNNHADGVEIIDSDLKEEEKEELKRKIKEQNMKI